MAAFCQIPKYIDDKICACSKNVFSLYLVTEMTGKLEEVYERMAPVYYWVFGLSLEGARKRAIRLANIQKGEKILEVGVGTGLTFKYMPNTEFDFTGIDWSEKMVVLSKKRADSMNRKYTLLQMDATQLQFPDESFDLIISAHFLSATSTPVHALTEMRRVLKKNGRILLVNNFQRTETMSFFEPIAKKMGFSLTLNLNELCLKTGLRVHKQKRVSMMPIDAALLVK